MNDNIPVIQRGESVLLQPAQSELLKKFKGFDPANLPYPNIIPQTVINNQREVERQYEQISKNVEKRDKAVTDRIDKTNELLEEQLRQAEIANEELQSKLDKANFELKQLNDKDSVQVGEIKQLRADLREESLKKELAETKLSVKDWKTIFISFVSGIAVTVLGGILLLIVTGG